MHPDRLLGLVWCSVSGRPLLGLGPSAEWGWERWSRVLREESSSAIYLVPIEIQLTSGKREGGVGFL